MRQEIVGLELGCGSRCTFYESIYISIHVEFEHASNVKHLTDVESNLRNRRQVFVHAPIAETVEFGVPRFAEASSKNHKFKLHQPRIIRDLHSTRQ